MVDNKLPALNLCVSCIRFKFLEAGLWCSSATKCYTSFKSRYIQHNGPISRIPQFMVNYITRSRQKCGRPQLGRQDQKSYKKQILNISLKAAELFAFWGE